MVDIPPEGLSGDVASVGGFALLWNGLVGWMTASMLTGNTPALRCVLVLVLVIVIVIVIIVIIYFLLLSLFDYYL